MLAGYKAPVQWFFVDEFPMTSSGKVQKFTLRDRIVAGAMASEPFEKPARS
jgi:fatty-acyl-CoA synthase